MKTKNEIEFEGKLYPVWYQHDREYKRYHPQSENLIIEGRTVASIELDEEIIEAFAECSVLDYYNKALGRTITVGRLQRALANPDVKDKDGNVIGKYRELMATRDPPKIVVSFKAQE